MTNEELKILLDDFGDHLPVRLLLDEDKGPIEIKFVDTAYYDNEIYLILEGG